MGFEGLPIFVVEHLQRIAKQEGFEEGYDVKHGLGSKFGDGYNAAMLSIKLSGYRRMEPSGNVKMNELALIFKLQPSSVAHQEAFNSKRAFHCEVYMYNTLLPALAAFQKEHQVAKEQVFASYPKCYETIHDDGSSESVIVMEDLRSAGFEMWKKSKLIDFGNVRLVLEQIGRFHGLSYSVKYNRPELFKKIRDMSTHFFQFLSPTFMAIVDASYDHVISLMDSSEDIELLQNLRKNYKVNLEAGLDEELIGKYGVINHGDCWLNNMMFATDQKGSAKSITLIDWQASRVTSPAIDLSYFLFLSTDKPLRDAHLDEFLQIYYTNLANSIRATGGDPDVLFPEAELHRQLRQFGIYGVSLAPLMIPVFLADSSEIRNIADVAESNSNETENSAPLLMYTLSESKQKHYVQRMKDVLADARRYGWL